MRILVIIVTDRMDIMHINNIKENNAILNNSSDFTVEYAGISSTDDFLNYKGIIDFKYKHVSDKYQLSKLCDFITKYRNELDYDWYIKMRTDIKLFETINFNELNKEGINARARVYSGPKRIKYGMSINGVGIWKSPDDCKYDDIEEYIVLDDQMFIFSNIAILKGGFDIIDYDSEFYIKSKTNPIIIFTYDNIRLYENESFHSLYWKSKNIQLNVVGINLLITKYGCYSGDLNVM
jgi:hypothetical protein